MFSIKQYSSTVCSLTQEQLNEMYTKDSSSQQLDEQPDTAWPAAGTGAAMERYDIDDTDRRIIAQLRTGSRSTVSDLSRRLSLARGTVHARLQRMEQTEVITGYGPDLNLAAAGFPVRAFSTLSIAQGQHDTVVAKLRAIPHILEVHTVTGPGDLLIRVAAETNDHLHLVLQQVSSITEVSHATTHLALASPVMKSAADLMVELDHGQSPTN